MVQYHTNITTAAIDTSTPNYASNGAMPPGLDKTRFFYKKPKQPGFFGKTHGFFFKARV